MRPSLAIALLGLGLGCLPNPQSVKERRENFPREGLKGELIFSSEPPDLQRVDAVFDRIKLVGFTLDPKVPAPGDRVKVTFYWTAVRQVAEDYQVFVHGDPIGGNAPRIHGDHYPAKGQYPTDVWQVGELVADPFIIWVPPGYGPKKLGIHTGLYKENYRVPLTDPGLRPNAGENRSLAVELTFP